MSLPARLRGARWIGAGLLDQVVIAAANAANTLLGSILLPRGQFGSLVLALSVGYFAMYLNRAFVGDVLLALASRYDGEQRIRLVRNGLASALCAGLATTVIFVALWFSRPHSTEGIDLHELIWLAPFMVAIMVHDTARCDYLAQRLPQRALGIDLVWVGTQGVLVLAMVLLGVTSAAGLLAAWGIGAVAGGTVYLTREKRLPWQGSPRAWLAETRHLSGWFTATAIIGQVQVLSISFLVASRLSKIEIGNLRFVQTVQLQPVQNLVVAVQSLLVPRASRYAADAGRLPGAEGAAAGAALRRQTNQLALAFALLGLLLVLVAWPVVSWTLTVTHKFADAAPLSLPIALQSAVYLLQVPFTAAMRGMHRARLLFLQYLIFATVSLSGLIIGAAQNGLLGAVWGLFVGSATGLVCMIGLYLHALRRVGEPEPDTSTMDTVPIA